MDQQTNHKNDHFLTKLSSRPIESQISQQNKNIYYSLFNNNFCLIDSHKGNVIYESPQVHSSRITCLRNKNNLLFTGSSDHTIKVFDPRSWSLVHTFQKIPSKFSSIDKSQHILAAGSGSNILFWDLRKMKQRSQFKDSFNGDVTHIRFQDQINTNLLGCSVDGMVNMFDLTQPNQQDSLALCYRVLESPSNFATAREGRVLMRTLDHNLYKIHDGDQMGKISVNNSQNPKHIVHCQFKPKSNYQIYQYFTWSPQQKIIQHWIGNFMDKNNQQKCIGYLNDVQDIQLFNILQNHDGKYRGIYVDQNGKVFSQKFVSQKKIAKIQQYENKLEIENSLKIGWKFSKKNNNIQTTAVVNKNGYMLQKPASSFANNKKFRPF